MSTSPAAADIRSQDCSRRTLLPLIAMALTAQAVNIVLMMLFFRFDGRDVRRIVTPSYALSDLIFVPAGILAAVLYNTGNMAVFWLFAGLMLLFVLSFNSIGSHRDPVQAERGPLTRLFEAERQASGCASRRRSRRAHPGGDTCVVPLR